MEHKAFFTRQELASFLGYSTATINKFPKKFPKFVKRGGKPNGLALYPIDEVEKWLRENHMGGLIKQLKEEH